MAAPNFFIVAGNTAPEYDINVTRGGAILDLSFASQVDVILYNKSTKLQTNSGHTQGLIQSATTGLMSYTAQTTDFPVKGNYIADIQVTWNTGTEILYNQAKWKVRNPGV